MQEMAQQSQQQGTKDQSGKEPGQQAFGMRIDGRRFAARHDSPPWSAPLRDTSLISLFCQHTAVPSRRPASGGCTRSRNKARALNRLTRGFNFGRCCSGALATDAPEDQAQFNWCPIRYLFASGLAGCPIAMLGESLPFSKGARLFCFLGRTRTQKKPGHSTGLNLKPHHPPRWQITSGSSGMVPWYARERMTANPIL